ncbi:MAG TPA: hypothetical protein VMB70_04145, partial [Terriglobia bacterium]|nr:hypothetical protein [Terriglobia bacterium]
LKEFVVRFKKLVRERTGKDFPADPRGGRDIKRNIARLRRFGCCALSSYWLATPPDQKGRWPGPPSELPRKFLQEFGQRHRNTRSGPDLFLESIC